jgi:hypothetical protein
MNKGATIFSQKGQRPEIFVAITVLPRHQGAAPRNIGVGIFGGAAPQNGWVCASYLRR